MWRDEEQNGGFFVFRQPTEVRIGLTVCETGPELHLYEHPLGVPFIVRDEVYTLVLLSDNFGRYLLRIPTSAPPVRSISLSA